MCNSLSSSLLHLVFRNMARTLNVMRQKSSDQAFSISNFSINVNLERYELIVSWVRSEFACWRWPRRAILDSLQAAMPSQEQKIEGPNKPSEKTGNNKIANGHSTMANGHSHTNGISPDLPEGSENVPQQNGHSSHKPPDVKDASPETTAKMTYSEQASSPKIQYHHFTLYPLRM